MGRIARVASLVALAFGVSAPVGAQPPAPAATAEPTPPAAPASGADAVEDDVPPDGGFRPNADDVAPSGRMRTEMTDEQRALYARGEAAARSGSWPTAARYYRAAVSLGGFNLGWLGLGEALGRLGRCAEAATALDAVATAPEVPEAPARFADAMALAQRQALGRTCPGKLIVTCAPPMTRFRIVGGTEFPCDEPVELPAGRYRLRAGPEGSTISLDAWVVGVETTRVRLSLPPPLPPDRILGPPVERLADPGPGPWRTVAWAATGLGAAGTLVGAGLHAATLQAYLDADQAAKEVGLGSGTRDEAQAAYDRHDGLRQATVITYAVGGALLAGGLVLLLADPDRGPSAPPGSTLEVTPTGLMGRF